MQWQWMRRGLGLCLPWLFPATAVAGGTGQSWATGLMCHGPSGHPLLCLSVLLLVPLRMPVEAWPTSSTPFIVTASPGLLRAACGH